MLRDDASLYESLAPKEESPILTKPLVAGLVTITVAGTLSLPLIFTMPTATAPVNQFRPDMAFADGMAWHLRTAKTAFASISLDAAPAPPHFAYCEGIDCYSDADVQKETWAWAPTCGSGRYQTPINIKTDDVATAPILNDGISVDIGEARLTPLNTGHNFQLTNTAVGPHAMLRGQKFNFAQVHFHTPSENTIDGQQFAMEGHYVFQIPGAPYAGTTNGLAVVGVLFDEGECNADLATFWELPPIDATGPGKQNVTGAAIQALVEASLLGGAFYQFTGSLTTPPCTEGVAWFLVKARSTVCKAQLERLKAGLAAVQGGASINNRKTQELNLRVVSQTAS
jgi:carbonic anhydrase